MREIDTLIIHCSATPPDMDIGADTIRKWHVEGNGWADIGYTYVIRRSGLIEPGRDLDKDGDIEEEVGAHAAGHNSHSLSICMVGGVDKNGKADCNFTFKQWASLDWLVHDIIGRIPNPVELIGHRTVDSGKECPSFDASCLL